MNLVLERLFTAAERSGAALLAADRDAILGEVDGIADTWLDAVVSAIANNLPAGGIKDVEWAPIKGALLASEPQIDQATNDRIASLFDQIVAALGRARQV